MAFFSRGPELTSLFEGPRPIRGGLSSFGISSILHGAGAVLLSYAILHAPVIQEPLMTERYSVRHLNLHEPESRPSDAAAGMYPSPATATAPQTRLTPVARVTRGVPLPVVQVPGGLEGKQTLIQPQFHVHEALPIETPVPTTVIWTPELASTKDIIPPTPDKPTAVDVKPSLDPPNEELNLGDMGVTAAEMQPKVEMPQAGTTSPLVVSDPKLLKMAPATVSRSDETPTPTAVLSLSDVRMPEGTVVLPPVNETNTAQRKDGLPPAGQMKAAPSPAAAGGGTAVANGGGTNTSTGTARSGTAAASSAGTAPTMTADRIQLPKDGKFGVVVVGTSLADEYPETLQIWSDRVAYTVFLHVGLAKSWILQYAQPRSAEAESGGNVMRLEAPWPYDILRPNLVSRDLNADALMVHGILNESGRLESLAVAFPAEFSHADFVLQALQQWQFRPARQKGKPTPVEILLIIPDETE